MKISAIILIALGLLWGLIAFNMEVTVQGAAFTANRIYNEGLMEQRRIHLGIAETLSLAGVILLGFAVLGNKVEGRGAKGALPAQAVATEPDPVEATT